MNYDIEILALTSDNKYIVSSGGNDILLWSMEERKQVAVLNGHSQCIKTMAITRNNRFIVSMDELYSIRVWKANKLLENPPHRVR